jgi:hypothetical protein
VTDFGGQNLILVFWAPALRAGALPRSPHSPRLYPSPPGGEGGGGRSPPAYPGPSQSSCGLSKSPSEPQSGSQRRAVEVVEVRLLFFVVAEVPPPLHR